MHKSGLFYTVIMQVFDGTKFDVWRISEQYLFMQWINTSIKPWQQWQRLMEQTARGLLHYKAPPLCVCVRLSLLMVSKIDQV